MATVKAIMLAFWFAVVGFFSQFSQPEIKMNEVVFGDALNSQKAVFKVEVAKSGQQKKQGLMYRNDMPLDQGMLFIYPNEDKHWFWMKNTYFPLDIIFISKDSFVVGIIHDARPEAEGLLGIDEYSQYILEVNSGLSKKYGINVGDKVTGLKDI